MWSKAIVIAVCCAQLAICLAEEEVSPQKVDVVEGQPEGSNTGASKWKSNQKPVRGKPSTEELRLSRQKQKEARGKGKPKTEAELKEMQEKIAKMKNAAAKQRPFQTPPRAERNKERSKRASKREKERSTTTGQPGTSVPPPGDRPPPSKRGKKPDSQKGKTGPWFTTTARPDGAAPSKPMRPPKGNAAKTKAKAKKDKTARAKKEGPQPDFKASLDKRMEKWREMAKDGRFAGGAPSKRRGQKRTAPDLLSDRQRRAGDAAPGAQPAEL